jgi:hypothetical protein
MRRTQYLIKKSRPPERPTINRVPLAEGEKWHAGLRDLSKPASNSETDLVRAIDRIGNLSIQIATKRSHGNSTLRHPEISNRLLHRIPLSSLFVRHWRLLRCID